MSALSRQLAILLLLLLIQPCLASDVFVGNKPFKGPVAGAGEGLSLGFEELAQALGLEASQLEDGWTLGGYPLRTRTQDDGVWVDLQDLPPDLVRIVYSKELNTVDIFRKKGVQDAGKSHWAAEGTLVFFYADWSDASRAMGPAITDIMDSGMINVALLNVDQPKAKIYRKYVRLFKGDKIPYTVLLNKRGKRIKALVGFKTYPELVAEIKKAYTK